MRVRGCDSPPASLSWQTVGVRRRIFAHSTKHATAYVAFFSVTPRHQEAQTSRHDECTATPYAYDSILKVRDCVRLRVSPATDRATPSNAHTRRYCRSILSTIYPHSSRFACRKSRTKTTHFRARSMNQEQYPARGLAVRHPTRTCEYTTAFHTVTHDSNMSTPTHPHPSG